MSTQCVGDITIDSIVEEVAHAGAPAEVFPEATVEAFEPYAGWMAPTAYDPAADQLIMATQAYLVRTGRYTILIDSCIGNDKNAPGEASWHQRTDFRLPAQLAEAGVEPAAVDFVLCTHLHGDHCGWNTQLRDGRWVPTFPNARYLFARSEIAFAQRCAAAGDTVFGESVGPVIEAGQADIVDTDHALDDGVWLEPLPGHTPGQVGVHMRSRGEHAVMCGDVMHSPVQLARPRWSPIYDDDPAQARVTRRAFLERCCDQDLLVMTAHFPLPSMGRIVSGQEGFLMRYQGHPEMAHGR